MRARGEVGGGEEGGEPVVADAAHEEVSAEPGDEQRSEQRDVVRENRAEEPLHRREHDAGQEQVLRERERVGQRVEVRRLEERSRPAPERLARPGEDPGVQPPVGPVHRPGVREIAGERPAHDDEEHEEGGRARRDLARRHGPRQRRAARHVPRREPHDEPGERGHQQRQRVRGGPLPRGSGRPEVARGDRLRPSARPGPHEPQPHAGPEAQDADVDRHRAAREADGFGGVERVAGALYERPPGQGERRAAAPFEGEAVPARLGNAQLARPAQPDPAARVQRAQVTPDDVDRSGPGTTHGPARVAHLGRETRRAAEERDDGEGRGRGEEDGERRSPGTTTRPRVAREGGQRREADERQGERHRADVDRRLGLDGRPARHGEDEQRDREGHGSAGEKRHEPRHSARILTAVDRALPGRR